MDLTFTAFVPFNLQSTSRFFILFLSGNLDCQHDQHVILVHHDTHRNRRPRQNYRHKVNLINHESFIPIKFRVTNLCTAWQPSSQPPCPYASSSPYAAASSTAAPSPSLVPPTLDHPAQHTSSPPAQAASPPASPPTAPTLTLSTRCAPSPKATGSTAS